jgi:hypothetical protein
VSGHLRKSYIQRMRLTNLSQLTGGNRESKRIRCENGDEDEDGDASETYDGRVVMVWWVKFSPGEYSCGCESG